MKIINLCKKYLLQHKLQLLLYIFITLAGTAISILSPYIIGDFLDNLIEGGNAGVILRFSVIFGSISVLSIVKNYIASVMRVKMSTQMSYDLNIDTVRHIQSLSLTYIDNKDGAYLNQRVHGDAGSLIGFCIGVLQNMVTNVILIIVPFVLLLSMNWFISLLLTGFLVLYAGLYVLFKKPLYNASLAFMESQNKFFAGLFEQLKYIKFIKINANQFEMNKRATDGFFCMKKTRVHHQKVNYVYSGLFGFISTIAQIILFIVGGLQILNGNFTIGMFTIFTSYFNMMLASSRYFFGLGAYYQQTLVAYRRIKEIFENQPEKCGNKAIRTVSKIELRDVCFSYSVREADSLNKNNYELCLESDFHAETDCALFVPKEAINNITMTFNNNKIYAIVGANGAGKSTIINLMIGLYIDEYSGTILYDNLDIRQIDMEAARRNLIGFAEQEQLLVKDSIRYNLDLGDESEDFGYIRDCIKVLNMENFISQNTFDYEINEKNTNASGGEKQKISILKVLAKNPVVMIFDEPTSAIDAQTTKRFIEHLQEIKTDKIIIIITHEKLVIEQCDEVVVVV